jgi:hypothetical protein
MQKDIIEDTLGHPMVEGTLQRVAPMTIACSLVPQIIEQPSSAVFWADSQQISFFVKCHGRGHFRGSQRYYVQL